MASMSTSFLDPTKQSELDQWLNTSGATDVANAYTDKAGLHDYMMKGAKWQDTLLNGTTSKKLVDSAGATIWDPSGTEYSNAWDEASGTTGDATGSMTGAASGATTYNSYDLHPEFNTGDPLYDGTETIHASDGTVSTPGLLQRAYADGTASGKIADEYRATLGGGQ